jgi:elongation factor P hydroxylase
MSELFRARDWDVDTTEEEGGETSPPHRWGPYIWELPYDTRAPQGTVFRSMLVEGTPAALDWLMEQAITYQFDQLDLLHMEENPDGESSEQYRVEEYVLQQLLEMEKEFRRMFPV